MKHLSNVAFWLGAVWSSLCALGAAAWSGHWIAGGVAAALTFLIWLVIALMGGGRAKNIMVNEVEYTANRKILEVTEDALIDYSSHFTTQFSLIKDEASRVQSLLSEAIAQLTESFQGMLHHVTHQEQLSMGLGHKTGDGRDVSDEFDEFVHSTSTVMQKVVESVVANSKMGMELVELTESISKRTHDVQAILSEIGAIAKQTNLLALNAAIEAARAGEAGRGFAVVADEVRDLSARTAQFSQQISALIQAMGVSVRQTEQAIQKMSAQDLNFALESKNRVEEIVKVMEEINKHRAEAMQQMSLAAGQVGVEVNKAVTALQFQDIVSQLLGHITRRVDALDTVTPNLEAMARALPSGDDEAAQKARYLHEQVDRMGTDLEGLHASTAHNPVSQDGMGHGEVELF